MYLLAISLFMGIMICLWKEPLVVNARLRFTLAITVIDDFLDLVNFVILEFEKHLLDFESVYH